MCPTTGRVVTVSKAPDAASMSVLHFWYFPVRATQTPRVTEYMYGQNYSFFADEQTTKDLYDRRFDMIFGLTHLGRFIPWTIPIILILLRSQISHLLGSHESTTSMLGFKGFADKMLNKLIDEHGIQDQQSEKEYKIAAHQYIHSSLPKSDKTGDALTQATMAAWSGGWDTTASSLTQCSYYLLKHPHVLAKLRQELLTAWPDSTEDLTYNMLISLPYLDAVSKESLRLMHGGLSRLTRINPLATEQYRNWTIPAGSKISMSIPDVNLDKIVWGNDSETFRPERWEGRLELDNWLMTFSRGTRVCAGQELAWMELKMIIGTLFRQFDMKVDQKSNITDADILPYSDGFTPGAKNYMQKLPVIAQATQT